MQKVSFSMKITSNANDNSMKIRILICLCSIIAVLFFSAESAHGQDNQELTLTADKLTNEKSIELDKAVWK